MFLFKAIIHKEAQELYLSLNVFKSICIICSQACSYQSFSVPVTQLILPLPFLTPHPVLSLQFPIPLPPVYSNTALELTLNIFIVLLQ